MDILKQYRIQFPGLKKGLHSFKFEANEDFFQAFESAVIGKSDVQIEVKFDKKESFFIMDFLIEGTVEVECDRCTEKFDQEIFDEHRVYVKFADDPDKAVDDEDIIFISPNDVYIDVSQLIYEFVNLSVPLQKICPPKDDDSAGCNENVLKILENKEQEDKEPDPRWAALKNLKNK